MLGQAFLHAGGLFLFATMKTPQTTTYSAVLGVILSNSRQTMGIEQAEMAARMGLSQPSYSRLESGKSIFSFDQMYQAASVLGLSTGDLISRANRYIADLERSGVRVVAHQRGNSTKGADGPGVGSLIAGAALGALIMKILSSK